VRHVLIACKCVAGRRVVEVCGVAVVSATATAAAASFAYCLVMLL